jgi:hypothetical protein
MLHLSLLAALLIQAAPAETQAPTEAPAAPAAATTPTQDVRFCIAAVETAAAMMRAQGGETAMQAAFLEGAVPTLQRERAGLGDTDEAALEAERARVRAVLANGPNSAPAERERFMSTCMSRLQAAFGGGR